jgi:hypothetical protein
MLDQERPASSAGIPYGLSMHGLYNLAPNCKPITHIAFDVGDPPGVRIILHISGPCAGSTFS